MESSLTSTSPTEVPTFVPFPKIPRLMRDIVISEKLDGGNASIFIPEDGGPMLTASRKRWVTPGKTTDFMGFSSWAQENEEELREVLGSGHHFGEWIGQKIQRGYGLDHRRFCLFNVSRYYRYNSFEVIDPVVTEDNVTYFPDTTCNGTLEVVPVLYRGPFDLGVVDNFILDLQSRGSWAVRGWMKPEGVIVFHTASGHLFKRLIENDELPKGLVG